MWKYDDSGEFLPGVPARDLTDEEYKEHAELIAGSKLYKHVAAKVRPAAKPAKEGEE